MSFIKSLFGIETPQGPSSSAQQIAPPCKNERELIELYGGIAFEKQLDFNVLVANRSWHIDMSKSEISFGPTLIFPMQVLGTFSHSAQTWLWAWENIQSGFSERTIRQALLLKQYGEENEIGILTNGEFDINPGDLHKIGLIASGMFKATGYYLADYGTGVMLVTIKNEAIDLMRKDNHHRIMTAFPQLIAQFNVNHKPALINYLTAKGYDIADEEASLTLRATKGENHITATFDHQQRLANITG